MLPEKKDTVFLEYDVSKMKTYKKSHDYIKRKIKGTEIGELFDSIKKNSRQQYFVVFVRAKGFAGFADLKNFIKTEGIDIGYDPVNNDSPIKL